jgi:hypothetical protein
MTKNGIEVGTRNSIAKVSYDSAIIEKLQAENELIKQHESLIIKSNETMVEEIKRLIKDNYKMSKYIEQKEMWDNGFVHIKIMEYKAENARLKRLQVVGVDMENSLLKTQNMELQAENANLKNQLSNEKYLLDKIIPLRAENKRMGEALEKLDEWQGQIGCNASVYEIDDYTFGTMQMIIHEALSKYRGKG